MSDENKDAGAGEGEDIEAFLRSLEEAEVPDVPAGATPKPVTTAPDTEDLDARFDALNDLVPDELPAKQPEPAAEAKEDGKKKKKTRKERAAEKKAEKERLKQEKIAAREAAEAATPAWKRGLKKGGLWAVMMIPMFVFVWILGAFLAHVISAGWLIALLALIVAIGLPIVVAKVVNRGKIAWWAAGLGIILTAALVAPMPKVVGTSLTHYGHWPTAVVGEVSGWEADNALANVGAAVARLFGSALGAEASGALRLGTETRLDGSVMPEDPTPTEEGGEGVAPEADTPAE
ncbi:hypothetical protein [Bradymonas sediminis]|uniref:Uncharacterized protein n=1 Tax=Bradymonas sediminis TaxID=1548548 RepID=A0A2Z4FHN3_9DELT|nr:hypothetical protein [Bradymonas sediminis]AWV88264.1 hypothetical protein DN745_02475 [Bradymonas sediminis]TDP77387.1 hypothetical protein DFR33_101287 [Bradymonas sediminis]